MSQYAQDFYEIPGTVDENNELQERIIELVANEPIPGKVTEGEDRLKYLRDILGAFLRTKFQFKRVYNEFRRNSHVVSRGTPTTTVFSRADGTNDSPEHK